MGDRGNIVFTEDGGGKLYFYTHWSGSDLPGIVARGLDRGRGRWNDDQYLARILFCQMIDEGNALKDNTGYGIGTTQGDGGTEVYVVSGADGTVTFKGVEYSLDDFVSKYKNT